MPGQQKRDFPRCAPSFRRLMPEGWESTTPNPPFSTQHENGCPRSLAFGDRESENIPASAANPANSALPRYRTALGARQTMRCYTLAQDGSAGVPRAGLPSPWPCRNRARSIFIERQSCSMQDSLPMMRSSASAPAASAVWRFGLSMTPRARRALFSVAVFFSRLRRCRHHPGAPRRRAVLAG